jgi:hypothetical protein
MTQAEKENVIKKGAEWLYHNLEMSEEEKRFWVEDFCNYMDICID